MRKRFLRPDGSSIWGDLVVACSRNADGTIRDLIGQISDVSELVDKTAYLEAAASAGVVGVWDWDVPRNVLTWDPVMFRLYGLRAEDFPGTREAWEAAVHPDDKPFVLAELQAALRGWRDYQPHFRVVWPDGSVHHLQARSRTTYGPDGMPLRMIGVNYDITEEVEREQEVEQQRQLLATTFDALVDPLLVLSLDDIRPPRSSSPPELRIAELNAAAARFFGRSQSQLLGQPLARLLPVAGNSALHADLLAVARGGSPLLAEAQPVLLRHSAEPRDLELRAVALRTGLVLSFRDITELRRAAVRLADSEERFRLLAENASDVVFRASLDGVTEWITASVTSLLGWAPANLIDRPFAMFVHPDDRALLQEADAALGRGERRQFRLRVQRRDGDYRWIGVNARGLVSEQGGVVGIIGSWRDVQAELEAETELDRRARIDPLTGLFNRQEILERLERLTRHRRQGDAAVAVLFCDIDHFKDINDRHGHGGGDAVLQALAQRLCSSTRLGDLVGRLGGDELLVVLQAMPSLDVAMAIAHKVHRAAREPLQLPTGEVVPTLSIGVTLVHPDEPLDAVVSRADQAMYRAKQAGRDRVVAFA
ncbi:MAG: diguanylate cyclase [Cyanobacteriota bacterium]|nr:diguanylate cyclase [Cyanobacteriota bacterium]